MLRKPVLWSAIALVFSVSTSCVCAESDDAKIFLDENECFGAFLAVVKSESIDYGYDYPFLYNVRGNEAETLWQHPSVWLEDEPSETRSIKEIMNVMGFRTPSILAHICEVKVSDERPGSCMIGMILENHGTQTREEGFFAALEFFAGDRCDALIDLM